MSIYKNLGNGKACRPAPELLADIELKELENMSIHTFLSSSKKILLLPVFFMNFSSSKTLPYILIFKILKPKLIEKKVYSEKNLCK